MNFADYFALSPLLILFLTALLILLLETMVESKRLSFWVTLGGLIVACLFSAISPASQNALLTPWLTFDSLARFFALLFLTIGIGTQLISWSFFQRFHQVRTEFFFLLLSSLFGLVLISSANDFLTLFLGIETLSISLYVLCSYMKEWSLSHESAFKYFLLGAVSTSFLLFGIALIYGATGETRFDTLAIHSLAGSQRLLFVSGIAFVTLSLLFKAAAVPFHIWAPDVYDGAPTPVTAFMAVGTKAGAFAALIRLFLLTFPNFDPLWNKAIAFIAIITLLYANFVAIRQQQMRRFFAYSGISHAGFLLIPLVAGGPDALPSMLFYLVIYTIATLGCFAVLTFLDDKSEGVMLKDLKGLFSTHPLLACTFAFCLLTLAGIPPTVGFFAKFYLLKVAFSAGYYGLVIVGLLMTILAAFYYLRIVAVMFSEQSDTAPVPVTSLPAAFAGGLSVLGIIVFSIYPEPLLTLFNP